MIELLRICASTLLYRLAACLVMLAGYAAYLGQRAHLETACAEAERLHLVVTT